MESQEAGKGEGQVLLGGRERDSLEQGEAGATSGVV